MLTRLFKFLQSISPSLKRVLWKWWYQSLADRGQDLNWSFMNYGFVPSNGVPVLELQETDEDDRVFIQLYHHVAATAPVKGKRVLEVGSGRGGGASFVARYHYPKEMVGMDFSKKAVELSARLHKVKNLEFIWGDAEATPFDDESFDVILNVESSHCYGSMENFIREVGRILKPNGWFSWADLRVIEEVYEVESIFANSGLKMTNSETITTQVLQALDVINNKKVEVLNNNVPRFLLKSFKDFAGVKDMRVYNGFKDGRIVYMSKVFKKVNI